MSKYTIDFNDTPSGGVEIHAHFKPTVGAPCSLAQAAALETLSRTRADWARAGIEVVHISYLPSHPHEELAQ